jgi:CHAT domain-containing protein/Tfp pilus assembly protein PilF
MNPVAMTSALWLLLAAMLAGGAQAAVPAGPPALGSSPTGAYLARFEELKRRSDWAGLEQAAREALAAPGTTPAEKATAMLWRGEALRGEDRFADAARLYRRVLAARMALLGEAHPDTALAMDDLGLALLGEGRYKAAEPLMRRALATLEKALGEDSVGVAYGETSLARLLRVEARNAEAEPLFRRALAIREKALGPGDPDTASSLYNLGLMLISTGRLPEAEELLRRALAIREAALGPDDPSTALSLGALALAVNDQGRDEEAEPLYRRALAATRKAKGPEHPDTAVVLTDLGSLLYDEGRKSEVEPLFRQALAINEKALGPEHPETAGSLNNLAFILEDQGRYQEAEALYRRALAADEHTLGPRHPDVALLMSSLGELFRDQGRLSEAETFFRDAARIEDQALGPDHPDTADTRQSLGGVEERRAEFALAAEDYRRACAPRSYLAATQAEIGQAASAAKVRASQCSVRLALSLWGWSAQGGGKRADERPEALKREAFVTAQRGALSAAGEAMAKSAALAAAAAAGVGDQAAAYEAALKERGRLDGAFAKAAGASGEGGVELRARLTGERNAVLARIAALRAELEAKAPRYWDYRSPAPVDVAALQARAGADAVLLSENEALLLYMVPPGKDQGLVFAVTKTKLAWARIPLGHDALEDLVRAVRKPIEKRYRAFDRQAAYDLYRALLGDPAIQAVIGDKPLLLFVPAGPLTSLPPSLLVTAPPPGGPAADGDQDALRATPWLLRSKAVALLPEVSSLRTLRQLTPANRARATDPLLAFADPDFVGEHAPAAPVAADGSAVAPRGYAEYTQRGHAIREALSGLPRLPGTLIEGEALVSALGGPPDSLLTGPRASKAELMARNADGRLARVRVLEFATHGLVAGAATWLAEPALAMAVGPRPEDELLLASEASTLKLNADWVLLSACNTASPDAPEAEGLSGLSRAFFFAGAQSLLVSHWPVRDDVASRLTPGILLAQRETPGLGRAQALRRAALAILDDPRLQAANPAAWAPFSVIGEAGP